MKKVGRRVWVWILSGLAVLLGAGSCFHIVNPKVYGPPEELYGSPSPKIEADIIPSSDTIVKEIEEER